VEVEDGRVIAVEGDDRNPVTANFICAKVRGLPEVLRGAQRLARPLRRRGPKGAGEFEPISWDEALDAIAERLNALRRNPGGESILPLSYGGSNGLLSQDTTDARLFRRIGASRLARTVCAAPTGAAAAALYGKMPGVGYEDYAEASLIVVWGLNPHASGIHILPFIRRARRNGATLIVVDPRRTRLAEQADLHLAVRPGTDLVLALAVIRRLLETGGADEAFLERHCRGLDGLRRRAQEWTAERAEAVAGLEPGSVAKFTELYRAGSPAVIRCGWGLERNRNGGAAAAAVAALPAVAGKFGVRGGGVTLSNSSVWTVDAGAAIAEPEPRTRIINMNRVGRALTELTDPPISLLFVYNNNPAMTLPRQDLVLAGLRRDDLFTVVFDAFLTDTARFGDIVLPAAMFLERLELARGYGAYSLQEGAPPVVPFGESRTNHEVFASLCRRLGLERPGDPATEEEVVNALLRERPDRLRKLVSDGVVLPDFGTRPVQFVDVFPGTPDGRVDLFPEVLERESPRGLYVYADDPATGRYPLALISPGLARQVSSTLGHLHRDRPALTMHPGDARPRGLRDGDRVRIFNEQGEVRCRLRVTESIRPGVVLFPKGLWSHHTENGATATLFAPDTLTDLGGGACFNDARVEVEAIPGRSDRSVSSTRFES